jgi:hypothetical protein
MAISRFDVMVNTYLATVPGLRVVCDGKNTGAGGMNMLGNVISRKAQEVVERGKGVDGISKEDVDLCAEHLYFQDPQKIGSEIFDKTSVYWTLNAHEFMNFYDKDFFKLLSNHFSGVFETPDAPANMACETVTRFFAYKGHLDPNLAEGPTSHPHAISCTRKMDAPKESTGDNVSSKRRKLGKFSAAERVEIQKQHFAATGEMISNTNTKRQREVGLDYAGVLNKSSVMFTDRAAWREKIFQEKLESGMTSRTDRLNVVIGDTNTGYLSKVIRHFARENDGIEPKNHYELAGAHMRPIPRTPAEERRTCAKREVDTLEAALVEHVEQLLKAQAGTEEAEEASDETVEDKKEDAVDMEQCI